MKDSYPSISVERLCWLLGLSRQALYKHRRCGQQKATKEQLVLAQVQQLRSEHPIMGTRKLYLLLQPFLQQHRIKLGRDALFSALARHQLLVRKRRRRVPTTQSHHWLKKHPNRTVNWHPEKPEQLWVADITYVPCGRTHLYLSLVTDAYSHQIMGYHLAETLEAVHCVRALQMAIARRSHPAHQLMHHSDRGIQYCSTDYINLLKENNIAVSMTQSGDPLENPIAERINGILKHEYLKHYKVNKLEELNRLLKEVVGRYNGKRPHQSIQMHTPLKVHAEKLPVNRHWRKPKRTPTIAKPIHHL